LEAGEKKQLGKYLHHEKLNSCGDFHSPPYYGITQNEESAIDSSNPISPYDPLDP